MQRDERMVETLKRRNKRVQAEPSSETADNSELPRRQDPDGDAQMDASDEEIASPGIPVFLGEDGLEYSDDGKPLRPVPTEGVGLATASSAASSSGASSSHEGGREMEVPDSPRQPQKKEHAVPSKSAKKQRVMLLEKSAENVMNVITKEHNSDELCDMET